MAMDCSRGLRTRVMSPRGLSLAASGRWSLGIGIVGRIERVAHACRVPASAHRKDVFAVRVDDLHAVLVAILAMLSAPRVGLASLRHEVGGAATEIVDVAVPLVEEVNLDCAVCLLVAPESRALIN